MATFVKFKIDGKECMAEEGSMLTDAAASNGVYIPTLCNYRGVMPQGSCRICNVMINNRPATACTTRVTEGIDVANITPELESFRKTVIELLFAEGNHMCPTCEKSGSCELQALGYRYRMMVPSFPYQNPVRGIEAWHPKLIKDHNRCIQCKRCIRGITNRDGKAIFAFAKRGKDVIITIDRETSKDMSDELAQRAMDICPVGAILRKEKGFDVPIGRRKYDKVEIGNLID
jgi:NADH dehydrogenase/NADH:ubiquinone oxidoreductase subunit G